MQAASKIKARLRSSWPGTLYYAQGLPFSVVRVVAQAFFRDQGVAREHLGLVALYGNAWTWKFLWSPFVDSFSNKRRWVLVMEFLLAIFTGVLALCAQNKSGLWMTIAALGVLSAVSATHDIATDGLYLEALDKDQQAKYSGWAVGLYRLALMTGSGVLIPLSAKYSWGFVFAIPALLFGGLAFWHIWILPDPRRERDPRFKGAADRKMELVEGFKTFFQLPGIFMAIPFFLLFKLGDAFLFGMSLPFLLDAGMTKAQFGFVNGILGTLAAIFTSIFGGWFISKFTLRRGLWLFGIIQNLAIPVYAIVARMEHPTIEVFTVAIVVEQIAAALGTAAYSNFLMRQTSPQYRATHYALASGMMALTTMLGGALSGYGVKNFGYAGFFMMAFFASIPGFLIVPFIARRPECQ